jgi:hypothetical protein
MTSKTAGSGVVIGSLLVLLLASAPGAGQLGIVKDGRYRHTRTGVELAVPVDWSILDTSPSSDGGDQMYLRYSGLPDVYVAVWMKPESNSPADADVWLQLAAKMKVDQRHQGGISQFAFRPESIQRKYVGERQAESAIADFTPAHAQPGARRPAGPPAGKMVEYFTWIFTERTRVQFDVRGAEGDAELVASRLEEIIQAARIP